MGLSNIRAKLAQLDQVASGAAPVTNSIANRIITGVASVPDPIVFSSFGPESVGVHLATAAAVMTGALAGQSTGGSLWPSANRGSTSRSGSMPRARSERWPSSMGQELRATSSLGSTTRPARTDFQGPSLG